MRAAARRAGDADAINLWAGQAHLLADDRPAGELVHRWSAEARTAIEQARSRLAPGGEQPASVPKRPAGRLRSP
jgi:NAD(P)H-dependent flavin oxidoreductase YrpB (nitropropane dioxygenase family)